MKSIFLKAALAVTFLTTAIYSKAQTTNYTPDYNTPDVDNRTFFANAKDHDDLLIYPNPTTSTARIVLPEASIQVVFVDIINMNGQVVNTYEYGTQTSQLNIDMSSLPVGLYSVRVYQNGMPSEYLKIVKN
jgi:hypothetical protein